MAHVLVVDDERTVCSVIVESLVRAGHSVTVAYTADEVDLSKIDRYDLLLFDVMMPGTDGLELCRRVRPLTDSPLVLLTARTTSDDVAEGLALGADDYLRKPFSPAELVARIEAHLRRERREHHVTLVRGAVRFSLEAREVFVEDHIVPLTRTEYDMCEYLARHVGQTFSRAQLMDHVSGGWSESDPAAAAEHIKNIRAKFAVCGVDPIQTVWGVGYRWR